MLQAEWARKLQPLNALFNNTFNFGSGLHIITIKRDKAI